MAVDEASPSHGIMRHRSSTTVTNPPTFPLPSPHPSSTPSSSASNAARRAESEEDPERPESPAEHRPGPSGPYANAPPPAEEVTASRWIAHYAGLVLASMIGCLIRLGLDALGTYDGQVIFSLAWSQAVGCAIMGLATAKKDDIVAIYPPLYTFITTGTAGSVTTFSSWMLEGYLSFANHDNYPRSGFYDSVDGFAYSFTTYILSLGALHVGTHLATVIPPLPKGLTLVHRKRPKTLPGSSEPSEKRPQTSPPGSSAKIPQTPWLDIAWTLTAPLAYLIALLLYFLAPSQWRHRATFPILLAPPGAILRFALSKLNPLRPFANRFPIGTFLANMSAVLIVSGVWVAQRPLGGIGATRCDALYALQQGFCGCLSTVSTFVVETRSIPSRRWKWVYAGTSVILGHVLVLAVVGGMGWTGGMGAVCAGSDIDFEPV